MFYFDSDKIEIKGWIKRDISELKIEFITLQGRMEKIEEFQSAPNDIFSEVEKYVVNQLMQNNAEYNSQISALKKEIADLKSKSDLTADFKNEILELKKQNKILRDKINDLKSDSTADFQTEISELKKQNKILQDKNIFLEGEIKKLWQEIKKLNQPAPPVKILQTQPPTKISASEPVKIPTPPTILQDSPEKFFYLPENNEVFISDNRAEISEKIKQALKVEEIQKYLSANNSDVSKKIQRLINVHLQGVQSFMNKLKLDDFEDEELSESITPKYFKLFQSVIFDNFLIAVKRGLKGSERNFYLNLLKKINEYLIGAGIYTVNAKSGDKVTDEDFENMTAQVIKTSDRDKVGLIKEIERLPYRINYLDEFGEKKYLQHNGEMTVFKAVQ